MSKKRPQHELVTSLIIPEDNRDSPPQSPKKASPKKKQKLENYMQQRMAQEESFDHQKYLIDELKKSEKSVGYYERQGIEEEKGNAETMVHDIEVGVSDSKILNNMYQRRVSKSPAREQQIADLISSSNRKIQRAQMGGQKGSKNSPKFRHNIPKSKNDLRELEKVDKYRLLKIKNGEIKNKLGDLRERLEEEYYRKKASYQLPEHENIKESDYYSIDNPRTKEANNFVHSLNEKRRREREKFEQYKRKKFEEQELKKSMMMEQQEQEKELKRKRLEDIFMMKKMQKQMQEEEESKKKSQIAQWSKIFQKEKPLYLRREEEFVNNVVIPELYEQHEIIMQRKMENRPIDIEEIYEHDERYMDFKRDDEIRKEAQIEMLKEKEREYAKEQGMYYKGKYRYMALAEEDQIKRKIHEDPAEKSRIKKARQIVYGDQVKEMEMAKANNKPFETRESQKKKFVKRVRNIDGSVSMDASTEPNLSHRSDPKADGRKNLHFLHELVKSKGIQKDQPSIRLVEEKGVYQDYLHDIKEKRRKSMQLSRIDKETEDESPSISSNMDSLKARAENLDEKVRRAEMRRKHQKLSHMEDGEIEEEELRAIKMKMQLLNTID